ncbi:MAG: hypothetical protein ACYDER_19370 [Ktedonobacteraceae bacterium]
MAQQQEAEQQQDAQNTQSSQQKQLQVNEPASQPVAIYPNPPQLAWPTSKPGPRSMLPPPGQKPMPGRTEQVVEVGYNQETGTPSTESPLRSLPDAKTTGPTSFDQTVSQTVLPAVKPQTLKKRKK